MNKLIVLTLLGITAISTVKAGNSVGEMAFIEGQYQHVVLAKDIQWRTCPPTLPKNCEMTILDGHPKKPNMFTVRFRTTGPFYMPPHTHPKDERVTVIKGKAAVAFGVNATREGAKEFGPGDYYVNKRDSIHKVWLEKNMILQITGIGPWEAHFVDNH